jgi:hypothetical protein
MSWRKYFYTLVIICCSCVYHDTNVPVQSCGDSALSLSVKSVTDASTCETADGIITISVAGGSEGYLFRLADGAFQKDSVFSNVSVGAYTITVVDSLGCSATATASVNSKQSSLALTVNTSANSGCPTANGSITINATGGSGQYMYKLNDLSFQSNNTFNGLSQGQFTVTVKDNSQCPTQAVITISRQGPSYNNDVRTIVATKCAISGCHNGSRSPNLSSFSGLKNNAGLVKAEISRHSMPPSNSPAGPLAQSQIDLITCWINDGAPNN